MIYCIFVFYWYGNMLSFGYFKLNYFVFVCLYENCNKMIDMWIKVYVIMFFNLDFGLICLNFDMFDF